MNSMVTTGLFKAAGSRCLIEGFRSAFLDRPFDWTGIGISMSVAAVVFLLGVFYFEKMERRFADII